MRIRISVCVLIVATAFSLSGCAGFQRHMPGDYLDPTENVNDDFGIAGREGRGNQTRQTETDWWWGKYFMSKKARMIEGDVGIEHKF